MPAGWQKITVDCINKKFTQTYTTNEIKTLLSDYPIANLNSTHGIKLFADKFCDYYSPSLGSSTKFFMATKDHLWYGLRAKTSRDGALIKTVVTLLGPPTLAVSFQLNPDNPHYTPVEISCTENKWRLGTAGAWANSNNVDPSTAWAVFGDKSPAKIGQRLLCSDASILQSAPTTKSPQSISSSIDDAKKKCSELGFNPNSTLFGECVLKISK
jgi:hypothetical protein